jgi:ribosomal protein L11 methyltransferase
MNRTPAKWLKYHFRKDDYDHELLMALIGGLSCLGVIEQEKSFDAFFNLSESEAIAKKIQEIIKSFAGSPPYYETEIIANQDWHLNWQEHFQPIQLSPNIAIYPYWKTYKGSATIQIAIKPGMAFGTGTHPTTQMALLMIEKYIKPGMTALDAGCGTGILTIAALKMGAQFVQAWDIDPFIEDNFLEHMELNGIHDRYSLTIGDIIKYDNFSVDLVLSNIERNPNLALLANIYSHGRIPPCIFSGILKNEYDIFKMNVLNYGLILDDEMFQDEWAALAVR